MKNTAILQQHYSTEKTSDTQTLESLAALYSKLLGETITPTQACHLLHAQVAGFMLLPLAAWNVAALTIGIVWFASALYGAKEAMAARKE